MAASMAKENYLHTATLTGCLVVVRRLLLRLLALHGDFMFNSCPLGGNAGNQLRYFLTGHPVAVAKSMHPSNGTSSHLTGTTCSPSLAIPTLLADRIH